MNENLFLTA